uniref:DB domain-containing protein n=1 Tax=Wuchereria bancrofti TaxID=6293 RepID=A0A1I8EFH4_WUCBA
MAKLCPKEKAFCLTKALQGQCYGNSIKAETLKRTCPCACDVAHFDRIQSCCKTVGRREMEFCLPLCRYNTTLDELNTSLGYKCVSQLTTWAYCAADVRDNTACCTQKGIAPDCLSFCKGDVPTCDLQSLFTYQPCLRYIETITHCHVSSFKKFRTLGWSLSGGIIFYKDILHYDHFDFAALITTSFCISDGKFALSSAMGPRLGSSL